MGKSDVLWDIKTMAIPADYTMAERLRADVGLRQDHEGVLLSLPGKSKLLMVVFATS